MFGCYNNFSRMLVVLPAEGMVGSKDSQEASTPTLIPTRGVATADKSQYEGVFQGIEAVHRTEQVRQQLLGAIERGDFKPGDALPSERTLTEIFEVSRVSVREAIRSLQAIGVLEVQHGRGCFVVDRQEGGRPTGGWLDLYRNEALDLLEVRGAIDQVAAERAAREHDSEAIDRIEQAHKRYVEAAADPATPVERLVELDIAFHESIGEASRNALAAHFLQDLNTYLNESRRIAMYPEGRSQVSGHEHAEIMEAIRNQRPLEAKAAAARHVEAVRTLLQNEADARASREDA